MSKIREALEESVITGNLLSSSLDLRTDGLIRPVFITALEDSDDKIPLFSHPYYFKTHDGTEILATDMRLYLKKKVFDGTLTSLPKAMTSEVEYQFTRSRAILNLEWLEGDVDVLKLNLSFATSLFGRWIADILSKAYSLDGRDQIIIAIASTYYYQALFTDDEQYDEDTIHKWSIHTAKVTNTDPKLIKSIFSKMPKILGVYSLIEAIKLSTDNIRLKDLNIVVLLTLIKNTWYGVNSKDIITVALEHPPTWMSVVHAAMQEKTFRSSMVYKIAERVNKRGSANEYLNQFHKILYEYSITKTHVALASAGLL
ncbi:MAG TPA: hypothetical protein VN843_14135 [Anaerolineales bacterium]|nr:hypothetical protein [Anaerolineales bacterium]